MCDLYWQHWGPAVPVCVDSEGGLPKGGKPRALQPIMGDISLCKPSPDSLLSAQGSEELRGAEGHAEISKKFVSLFKQLGDIKEKLIR